MGEGGGGAPRARRQAGCAYARPPAVPHARRTRMPWRSSKGRAVCVQCRRAPSRTRAHNATHPTN
eukprot:553840-Prymnesium_polylepis.1